MDRTTVVSAFEAHFRALRRDLKAGSDHANEGSRVDGDHRPQNRGERGAVSSAAYLGAALKQRVAELDEALNWLERVAAGRRTRVTVGALVTVDDGEAEKVLFLMPGGQGTTVPTPSGPVTALSPNAPLVRALQGLRVGDAGVFRDREWAILDIG